MIKNRPKRHQDLPYYKGLPPLPYCVELDYIPELVRLSLLPLRHIEPLTTQAAALLPVCIEDAPTEEELGFYKQARSSFQIVFVVVNSIFCGQREGASHLLPYAVSLIPASKRGKVEKVSAEYISCMTDFRLFAEGSAYLGLDTFTGDWTLFSQLGLVAEMGSQGAYTDELGLVHNYYFLREDVDPSEIVQPVLGMPPERLTRYMKHRSRLLYTPFKEFKSRQIWGVENALELFLYQEIGRQSLPVPVPQALIFDDGSWYPSLYHQWQAFSSTDNSGFITEVDFFFPEKRLAVFCDGGKHSRREIKLRDCGIDEALKKVGIDVVRLKSKNILNNVEVCVEEFAQFVS